MTSEAKTSASSIEPEISQQQPDEEPTAQRDDASKQNPETDESPEAASAEPEGEKPADDAASKAKQRLERFKALQARAVSRPSRTHELEDKPLTTQNRKAPRKATSRRQPPNPSVYLQIPPS